MLGGVSSSVVLDDFVRGLGGMLDPIEHELGLVGGLVFDQDVFDIKHEHLAGLHSADLSYSVILLDQLTRLNYRPDSHLFPLLLQLPMLQLERLVAQLLCYLLAIVQNYIVKFKQRLNSLCFLNEVSGLSSWVIYSV
jgi:hypothetical protein